MKNNIFTGILIIILFLVLSAPVMANSDCEIEDLSKALPEGHGKVLKLFYGDWIKSAKVCDLGFYKIAVPSDEKNNSFFIWNEKGPFLLFQDGFGLNMFNQNTQDDLSNVLLTIQDWDKNGVFDRLDYKILNDKGQFYGDVTDFDMDGQPDLKIYHEKKNAQIWLNGKWYDLNLKNDQRGIIERGKFIPVELKKGKWILKKVLTK